MGCNCKNDKNSVGTNDTTSQKEKQPLIIRGIVFITKTLLFLIGSVIASIIVIPFSVYMLFKAIYLNEGIDITNTLVNVGKTLKKKETDDDDEEEYEFEDEDELELLNVQE